MGKNGQKLGKAMFVRNHYYPGKLLHASDFVREQEYVEKKRAFAGRKFYGSGIIDGLDVLERREGEWYVTAGSAMDASGRLLVLPEGMEIDPGALAGEMGENGKYFVLGVRYAEWPLEKERSAFEGEGEGQAARIAEGVAFGAYSIPAWRELEKEMGRGKNALASEQLLYGDGELQLFLRLPKVVPADSVFRIHIQAQAVGADAASVSWRGVARLTGAFFTESGSGSLCLEKGQASFLGQLDQEWEICTEEGRNLPVFLELDQLELFRGGMPVAKIPNVQAQIELAGAYRLAAEKYLWEEGGAAQGKEPEEDVLWVPLACFKTAADGDGKNRVSMLPERGVRFYTYHPQKEEVLRRAVEEFGIVDLSFRRYQKIPAPLPPAPPLPPPPKPEPFVPEPKPLPGFPDMEIFGKYFGEQWEKRIHRGVAVIPVPGRYHKGQVLCSEEIPHGFAGEEVFLWCGRLHEAQGHVYWERDKKAFFAIQGDEELFTRQKDVWRIEKQALRQNVAEGTFQIALTLAKGSRRNRVGEVAIAWVAVRSI